MDLLFAIIGPVLWLVCVGLIAIVTLVCAVIALLVSDADLPLPRRRDME